MVEYTKCLFILLVAISAIKCENCIKYDFESNFYDSFDNDNPLCAGMGTWKLANYSSLDLNRPHQETESFITPDENLSCVSSYGFEMESTGIVEVYVYMESTTQRDQIVVLANEVSSTGNIVTGTVMLTPLSVNYFNGWHVLRINLFGTGVFKGYLTFLGVASPESKVIVDSFRYIPPLYEDDCHVYDGDFITSSPLEEDFGECVVYNFENDFDELFNNERGLCKGFTHWNLHEYSSLPIDHPSAESLHFISPQNLISCVSSFPFEAEVGGVVEVIIYMESREMTDQISVLVNKIAEDGNDLVMGIAGISALSDSFVDGWHVLKVDIFGTGKYNGYLSFVGLAAEESVVLIDSFRYIPPSQPNREECKIYEDEEFEITTPEPTTTISPIGNGEECVTYNFESNFENSFDTTNALCSGHSSWHLGDYHSLDIETINPGSNTFIAPNDTSSCVSSFFFRMMPGGVVEVNTFMKSASNLDYIIVLAKRYNPSGVDTVAGFQLYYATNENFFEGWSVLKVTIMDNSIFDGYITLLGSTAEDSIVLVDSFSYTPPNYEETCDIY